MHIIINTMQTVFPTVYLVSQVSLAVLVVFSPSLDLGSVFGSSVSSRIGCRSSGICVLRAMLSGGYLTLGNDTFAFSRHHDISSIRYDSEDKQTVERQIYI